MEIGHWPTYDELEQLVQVYDEYWYSFPDSGPRDKLMALVEDNYNDWVRERREQSSRVEVEYPHLSNPLLMHVRRFVLVHVSITFEDDKKVVTSKREYVTPRNETQRTELENLVSERERVWSKMASHRRQYTGLYVDVLALVKKWDVEETLAQREAEEEKHRQPIKRQDPNFKLGESTTTEASQHMRDLFLRKMQEAKKEKHLSILRNNRAAKELAKKEIALRDGDPDAEAAALVQKMMPKHTLPKKPKSPPLKIESGQRRERDQETEILTL